MSEPLYFIAIIAGSLRQTDPEDALRAAFEKIDRLGRQPRYAEDYQQFIRFMSEVCSQYGARFDDDEESIVDVLAALLVERATRDPEDMEEVTGAEKQNASRWQADYERLWNNLRSTMVRPPVCEVIVQRDGNPIATCPLDASETPRSVSGILPGDYSFVLETGRVLWEGHLDERDLLWTRAFPAGPLRMVADTGRSARSPTRQLELLEGALVVCVYPDLESGSLEIGITNTDRSK